MADIYMEKTTMEEKIAKVCEQGKTMLAGLGIFYLLQMTQVLSFINVAVPEEVQETMPKAAIARVR